MARNNESSDSADPRLRRRRKYPDHEFTHFLGAMILYKLTDHWLWLVVAIVSLALFALIVIAGGRRG